MTDALKLVWAQAVLFGARKILVMADGDAASHFRRSSWMAAALRHLGIQIHVVELSESLRKCVREAQARQFR